MKNLKKFMVYLKGNTAYVVLSAIFALLSVFSKMAIPFVSGLAIQEIIDACIAADQSKKLANMQEN